LLLVLINSNSKLFSQNNYRIIIGRIIDEEAKNGVPYVHIKNLTDNIGAISDSLGIFKIKIKSDTVELKYSAIGYYTKTIVLNYDSINIPFNVFLKYRIYEIMQVDVYPFTKKEFKHKFVHDSIPKDNIDIIKDNLKTKFNSSERLKELAEASKNKLILAIPLNFKTDIEKQEELLEKIKELSRLKTQNIDRIKRITNLTGKELYDFESFCKFNYQYLKSASEYTIYTEIYKLWEEYKKIKYLNNIE